MYDTDFDKQKLMYHPAEVAEWLAHGRTRGPLYTEMELGRQCSCKCVFCGVDHQVNKTKDIMNLSLAGKIIDGLAELGNRAVMICGHGEPLLNPEAAAIINYAAGKMSVSVTTNGIALTGEKLPLVDKLEWLRFSVNGCNPENYARIHCTGKNVFESVLGNISAAVQRKAELQLPVTIGIQLVLLPENAEFVVDFARRAKGIGVDYFSVKPYSQHPMSEKRLQIDYADYLHLGEILSAMEDESFRVIFRSGAMVRSTRKKPYEKCYGTHFISFISANGDVWECNVFAGDRRFFIGNAAEESMNEIWNGRRREQVLEYIHEELDLEECRNLCRMDACNSFLWRLKNPWPHDNFI